MSISPTTKARRNVLDRIVKEADARSVFLWLVARTNDKSCLRLSYHCGEMRPNDKELRGCEIPLNELHIERLAEDMSNQSDEMSSAIKDALSPTQGKNAAIDSFLVKGVFPDSPALLKEQVLGVISLVDSQQLSRFLDSNLPDLMSSRLSHSRTQRIVSAVFENQEKLRTASLGLETALFDTAWQARKELGARRVFFRDHNGADEWFELVRDGEELTLNEVSPSESSSEFLRTKKGSVRNKLPSKILTSSDAMSILVPLWQPGFKLSKQKFRPVAEWSQHLEAKELPEFSFVFEGKRVEGYLQDVFSETDVAICRAIYRSLEPFATLKSQEEMLSKLLRFFQRSSDDDLMDPDILLAQLRKISSSFAAVYCGKVYASNSQQISYNTTEGAPPLSEDYLSRLKNGYFEKFIVNGEVDAAAELFVGVDEVVDEVDGKFLIEAHFPSGATSSNLLLLLFEQDGLSKSVQRSLERLFHETQIRLRRRSNESERSDSLVQIRHALIHQFTGAYKSLDSALKTWNLLAKHPNPVHWNNLRKDMIFEELVPSAVFSLSQATALINNGRFLIGDIDSESLNRKRIDIVDIVSRAFRVIDYLRHEKGIIISHKVDGIPPPLINGDKVLLEMAILNLADNAVKFSMHLRTVEWKVEFLKDNQRYRFSVSNIGGEITEAEKFAIQGVGYRGMQKDRLNQRPGTGFGLPVTKKILKAHWPAAELNIESVPLDPFANPHRNTFSFEMPYLTGKKET